MRRIFFALLLLGTVNTFAQTGTKQITLEDIWTKNTFKHKTVPGFNVMNDGKRFTQTDDLNGGKSINIYNLASGKKETTVFDNTANLFNGDTLRFDSYAWSRDEQQLLLFTAPKPIYRRSVNYLVYCYDLKKKKIVLLDSEKVLHATFSPDGSKVAFVKNNNLYYKDIQANKTVQITRDGERNKIINGNCDWVYEEEFQFTRAFDWAPDGAAIAYYRFDESLVPEYTMTVYDSLYPTPYKYKYPKAGETNSVVQIHTYQLANGQDKTMDVGPQTDQYIPRIKWTNNNQKLCIFRLNRLQNKLELLLADAGSGSTDIIYLEQNPFYIEINDNLQFLPDNESFIFNSEQDGWNHLFIWNWKKQELTHLTDGNYDIETLVGVDTKKETVYYTAAVNSPMERKLYAVNFAGEEKRCLTPEDGTHNITPCAGNRYFLDEYSSLTKPPYYYLRDASGKIVRTLEENNDIRALLKEYAMGNVKMIQVNGAGDVMLNAWMMTPPDFDEHKKYPVLMFQYSGPNSQQVADKYQLYTYFWHQMLAEQGYIIVCVDGTGTGFRGQEFRKKTYMQLGKYESDDQIAAAKHLGALPYVDQSRIGIWGWSYGGFMSSTCIFKGADVFKMAIAVAPVTNWRYYDDIYTERFMRTPQENPKGYDDNSPANMVASLKGKFLLIHGTGDDNVHFQNSVMMVNNMISADKSFDSEYYPNRAHGISGGGARLHLFRRMTDFIHQNL